MLTLAIVIRESVDSLYRDQTDAPRLSRNTF